MKKKLVTERHRKDLGRIYRIHTDIQTVVSVGNGGGGGGGGGSLIILASIITSPESMTCAVSYKGLGVRRINRQCVIALIKSGYPRLPRNHVPLPVCR